jgi:uncharacterized protein (DUF1800 family)
MVAEPPDDLGAGHRASGPPAWFGRTESTTMGALALAGTGLGAAAYRAWRGRSDGSGFFGGPPPDLPGSASISALALPDDIDTEHVLSRVTYGATPQLRRRVADAGLTSWLQDQLSPASVEDPEGDAVLAAHPRLAWSIEKTVQDLPKDERWPMMVDLAAAHIGRAIWSRRQLFEVMVDFWSNHLNITTPSGGVWMSRHRFDADVIRAHALGRFEDMLVASTFHPAMLVYLNADESTGKQPNENYARELLELHTVSVHGGYDEQDIKQAAKLITGWQVDENGKRTFSHPRHATGQVQVMDWSHPNDTDSGAMDAVVSLLKYLANHRATATFLARKLAVRFVSDDPPAELVDRLAAVYLREGTAILPVLVTLFSSPEFADSSGAKVRRPFEALVATARILGVGPGTNPKGLTELYWMLGDLGHQPLAWAMPNGYSDVASDWQSPATALNLVNTTMTLVQGWWPKHLDIPSPDAQYPSDPSSRAEVLAAVTGKLFNRAPTETETKALDEVLAESDWSRTALRSGSWQQQQTLAVATTLLLSSPAFRIR